MDAAAAPDIASERTPRLVVLRQADGTTLYRLVPAKPAQPMLLAVCVGGTAFIVTFDADTEAPYLS